jgi:hypothetical protein
MMKFYSYLKRGNESYEIKKNKCFNCYEHAGYNFNRRRHY